ncbi:MAG: hypothetical protein KatS3mg077_2891 [Candidatus Binatia bacterium]|nr:MAG: hypothetical protein KatS3mg077_2891 [Candidatus Binatia bacterium]
MGRVRFRAALSTWVGCIVLLAVVAGCGGCVPTYDCRVWKESGRVVIEIDGGRWWGQPWRIQLHRFKPRDPQNRDGLVYYGRDTDLVLVLEEKDSRWKFLRPAARFFYGEVPPAYNAIEGPKPLDRDAYYKLSPCSTGSFFYLDAQGQVREATWLEILERLGYEEELQNYKRNLTATATLLPEEYR